MSPLRTQHLRRGAAGALGVAAATALLVGCAGTSTSPGSTSGAGGDGDEQVTIGFAVAHLTDAFQLAMIDYAKADAEEAGARLLEPTNADDDAAKQNSDVQTILSQSPGALLLSPVDAEAVVPVIERANQQDVPVIAIDQAPAGGEVFMTVRADNVGMGATGCEAMGEFLGGSGTVLELQGALSSANGLDRSTGFNDCMKENFPDIEVISQPTDWLMEKASAAVQTVVSTEEIDGIFTASDYFLPGIEKTLQSLNKWVPAGEEAHVALVGIDGAPDALGLIREGYMDATVSQPANLYAEWAIKYAIAGASGETFEAGPTDHDSEIVETDTGLADLLTAPLVTKDNVDDEILWGNAG